MQYPPLHEVKDITIGTAQAAFYLNRSVQTLHQWKNKPNAPLRALRSGIKICRWRTNDIRAYLGEPVQ